MTTAPEVIHEDHHESHGGVLDFAEEAVEKALFASRWLLAPLYIGLIGGLICILIKFAQSFWDLIRHVVHDSYDEVTLKVLMLLDATLLANLVLIIVFAGYENFVSKIGAAQESEDRPHWMGHVDYSGLKMKLIGSIVAISVIGLLSDFLHLSEGHGSETPTKWHILIHFTFLASGVLFSVMDYISEKRMQIQIELLKSGSDHHG